MKAWTSKSNNNDIFIDAERVRMCVCVSPTARVRLLAHHKSRAHTHTKAYLLFDKFVKSNKTFEKIK